MSWHESTTIIREPSNDTAANLRPELQDVLQSWTGRTAAKKNANAILFQTVGEGNAVLSNISSRYCCGWLQCEFSWQFAWFPWGNLRPSTLMQPPGCELEPCLWSCVSRGGVLGAHWIVCKYTSHCIWHGVASRLQETLCQQLSPALFLTGVETLNRCGFLKAHQKHSAQPRELSWAVGPHQD